ncbi:MAG: YceI family protein [Candidatus Marinimicrobia bacterium]|nr:YceI family protein [Candidatus Neomarinimicrobiota bacterium]MBT3632453.1 YceI family protein [Candidatus Neomarinimicrobiota bacterium]MBT3826040.1 YceI family protein [Candidatus Neomarinimicrobiota bacterium]MBT4132276.1 YceI family protein [Candidatus Neomarinimicrobiota bacterium]MBT4296561.1 YceI family protein [Candidatus Neomarinimicrobiota bacterium]
MNKSTKNISVGLTTLLLSLSAFASTSIDVKKSTVEWLGKKVTGQHSGSLDLINGDVTIEKGEIISGRFVFDMTSIKVLDIKDKKWNKKLEQHLKKDDFFGVNFYPKAVFDFKIATPIKGAKAGEPNYHFKGDLTLKGITHALDFDAYVELKKSRAYASGQIIVDRTKYNIRYKSNKFFDGLGDKTIYDEFLITFSVQTK